MSESEALRTAREIVGSGKTMVCPIAALVPSDDLRLARALGTHNRKLIDSIREQIESGEIKPSDLDPLDIVKVGNQLLIADGYHRYESMKAAGVKAAHVRVVEGTKQDAAVVAAGRVLEVDSSRKTETTKEDRYAAILVARSALGEEVSNRRLARILGIGHQTVSRALAHFEGDGSDAVRDAPEAPADPEAVEEPSDAAGPAEDDDSGRWSGVAEEMEDESPEAADRRFEPKAVKVEDDEEEDQPVRVEAEPEIQTDRFGVEFPSEIARVALTEGVERFDSLLVQLTSIRRVIGELAGGEAGAYLDEERIARHIDSIRAAVKSAKPYCVFVQPEGEDMEGEQYEIALKAGYITLGQHDSMRSHFG